MTLPSFVQDPRPETYLDNNYVTLDFETSNLEFGSPYCGQNFLILACWRLGKGHPDFGTEGRNHHRRGDEFSQHQLLQHIERAAFIVAHNAKFELGWLRRCGVDLRRVLAYCTQIGEYVIAGNRKYPGGLGLDASCERYGISGKRHAVSALIASGVPTEEIPSGLLLEYCRRDVESTEALFLRQREELGAGGLLPVGYCRNLVTPVLVDIESRGMCLDSGRVTQTAAEYSGRYQTLLKSLEELTGGINPKSVKQMREYLYGTLAFEEAMDPRGNPMRTAGGKKGAPQPRTDKLVLPLLKAHTEPQKQFKELAIQLAKLKVPVQNLTKMKKVLDSGESIVYANFNQTVLDTHRLNSTGRGGGGFNFHQFDRAFKPLFKAREGGWRVVEADAPQLEFRIAAHLGSDDQARKDILDGSDIHAFTASIIGCSRQSAKAHTFKPLYGGRSGTPKEKKYYEAFKAKYKGIAKTQEGWTWEVLKNKQLRIASGLVFYWPDTKLKDGGYVTNTPVIYNYPVQSFATADIIPLTLVLLWHSIANMDAFLVNTIHDSVIAEVPESELDSYRECLVNCFHTGAVDMVKKLYGVELSVPLGVDIKVGAHWGESDGGA